MTGHPDPLIYAAVVEALGVPGNPPVEPVPVPVRKPAAKRGRRKTGRGKS